MNMSLKRKCFELKRMLRHRSFLFLIFAVVMVMFVLSVAYSQDHPGESHHEHEDHARALNNKGGDDRPAGVERRDAKANDDDDIGAKADPYTIFKRGEVGNYEPKEAELIRDAPGEQGKAVVHDGNAPEVHKANSEFGFNTFVSDMISLNRTIPDTRDTECKYWHYPEKLPTASVVVVFHNEGWTPLMRTVHSVLLRSPPHLLHEVLMVDDFSDKEHLKSRLDKYLEQFNGKVRLVRNSEREGLIRARSIGAQNARGDVVVFLDAHCEANVNWLPPLLAPIANDRRVMTVPIIDGIDMNTWSYRRQYAGASALFRGIFEWGLLYKETELPAEEKNRRKYPTEPFRSPTHAGGLFAIDRKWFSELGYYDSGLQIWGGEQYELSFKIWQCGGGILFVPCSHVGHVYRNRMPYGFGKLSGKPVIATNLKRVVESWMDEYGKYYYIREPMNAKRDPGDLTAARAIREKNNCKSFKWFMEKVAYDVVQSYPLLPENKFWGEARNAESGKCMDTMGQPVPGTLGATPCHGYGGNQLFRLNMEGQMASGEWCITPVGNRLQTGHCQKGTVDGPWEYRDDTKQLAEKRTDRCMTPDVTGNKLTLQPCDPNNNLQKWTWREIWND